MKLQYWLVLALVILAGCNQTTPQNDSVDPKSEIPNPEMAEKGYVGPSVCADCHLDIYNNYRATAHPFKIHPAEEAQIVGLAAV